ncbi:transcription factor Adf-1 [Biomphalaria glabrata]|nr:transcription factor Adf-1 [Biomphalaria glabrata]
MAAYYSKKEKIIELIQKYPVIYNPEHPDYKNKKVKNKIYASIGGMIGDTTGAEVQRKWKNLKDYFIREMKIQQTGQSFKSPNKWIFSHQMEFLRPYVSLSGASNGTFSNVGERFGNRQSDVKQSLSEPFLITTNESFSSSPASEDTTELLSISDIKPVITTQYERPQATAQQEKPQSTTPHVPKHKKRRLSNDSDTSSSSASKIDKAMNCVNHEKYYDRVDCLFLGYADFYKKLSRRGQISIKLKMAQIFTEEELKELDNQNNVNNTQ